MIDCYPVYSCTDTRINKDQQESMLLVCLIFSLGNCGHLVYTELKLGQTTKHNMVAVMVESSLL